MNEDQIQCILDILYSSVARLIAMEEVLLSILLQSGSKYCAMDFFFHLFSYYSGKKNAEQGGMRGKRPRIHSSFTLNTNVSALVGYMVSFQ